MAAAQRGEADFRDTRAAQMLAEGFRRTSVERGLSQRDLAKQLGYKQSVVLSHMALGRVPIPIDRAPQLAQHLGLDEHEFLLAVLEQRHPDIPWRKFAARSASADDQSFVGAIALIAGVPVEDLTPSQRRIMLEVAAAQNPEPRWLSVHEVPAMQLLRRLRPEISTHGLSETDERTLAAALSPRLR